MVGSAIIPIATTVAPTMPVEAASSAPTKTTDMPKTTAQLPEQPAHRVEQFLGDAAFLQHRAHQHEQRNGDQHLIGHQAERYAARSPPSA
jgi:hypothetical protein